MTKEEVRKMKKYIGTKEVKAMPMTLGEFFEKTGRNPYQNDGKTHDTNEEGYLVEYSDSYRSWSPKDVFNKAYKCSKSFLDRLHIELKELYDKMDKLVSFIDSGKMDEVITDEYQKYLLRLQHRIMSRYINVLECRIGRLDGAPQACLHQMTFGDAVEVVKLGGMVRRTSWDNKDIVVFRYMFSSDTRNFLTKKGNLVHIFSMFIGFEC